MTNLRLSLVMSVAVVLPVLSCAEMCPRAGTPKRVDGLIAQTITAKKVEYDSDEKRLELISKALAHRQELLNKFPLPVALCKRVPDGAVKVDGELSEDEWKGAMVISGFRETRSLKPESLPTRAMLQWDSRYLYVAFESEDTDVIGTITVPDGEFWREDTFEVFIDVDGDEMSYVEYEVSARGLLYDATLADYRPEIDWPPDLQHLDVEGGIKTYNTRDTLAAVKINGTLNKSDDKDKGWSCELAVSWKDIARGTNVRRLPPMDGDVWRMGLYRININTDKKAAPDEYAAWNPTTSWFHVPWVFGKVVFTE